MTFQIHDATRCALGEGPLWHPERQQLFWFDILGKTFHCKGKSWTFDHCVSAAAWIDRDTFLIAGDTGLFSFNVETKARMEICPLEADKPETRSNDGRADPWGGFWIGTMGLNAEPGAGAIYRYWDGTLRCLVPDVTIPNAICFSADRRLAYYTDTAQALIWCQPLNPVDGWPQGPAWVFLDLAREGLNPDGAVCDAEGGFWNAQWGAARVARYTPEGIFDRAIELPTDNITCPAFGGADLKTLFLTSATTGLGRTQPEAGKTFAISAGIAGQAEHRFQFVVK